MTPLKPISLAIIGCGHWGRNYVRNFSEIPNAEARWCVDLSRERLEEIKEKHPTIRTATSIAEPLMDPEVKAVVVATQASTHFPIVKACLKAGKDVLAEKPLALTNEEAEELADIASEEKRILMVGHTFLYNEGVRKMKELISSGEVGEIYFVKAVRSHLGLIREDVNVAWDLASHDLSILNYLLEANPIGVQALGSRFFRDDREDVVFITLQYPRKVLANVHVSWADSNKQRSVEIVGSRGRIVFDDLNPLEPVRLYQRGIALEQDVNSWGDFKYQLRDGDIISPKIKMREPLRTQCEHFLECIKERKDPLTSGRSGLEIVRTMVEIESQLRAQRHQ